ncbi:MAG: toxin-antitoxin system HicB family antitoxin [Spirochaetota bacterium]
MATKRNTLTIRVPEELKQRLEKVATLQGVSVNQFALYAFTKEIADLEASSYFQSVLKGVDKKTMIKEMDRILAAVPERTVPEWDRMEDAGG